MEKLTLPAKRLNGLLVERGFNTTEARSTSTCKALGMPVENRGKIQAIFTQIGLSGTLEKRTSTPHETDAIIAALTVYLYTKNETEALGNGEEECIIIPKRQNWRKLQK